MTLEPAPPPPSMVMPLGHLVGLSDAEVLPGFELGVARLFEW